MTPLEVHDSVLDVVAKAIFVEADRQDPTPPFGYADADDGKTILDGAFNLNAIAAAAIDAYLAVTTANKR